MIFLNTTTNINELINEISKTCIMCNRKIEEITLIAVTKTVEIENMKQAKDVGLINFGENKVQEFINKYDYFDNEIKWHMIGHLQRNKVKYIIDKVNLIQSLDSYRLAEEIQKQSANKNLISNVLIEINIGDELSKNGIKIEEVIEFVEKVDTLDNICIRGIMTVAPHADNAENIRPLMKKMKIIFEELKKINLKNAKIDILSMGMSNDYKIAIEEGTTMIRIGSLIFGERTYQGGANV